jgi:hypothetical protein
MRFIAELPAVPIASGREPTGVGVVPDRGDVPGELGGDGLPPLPQGRASRRELPGPLVHQHADRGTEPQGSHTTG